MKQILAPLALLVALVLPASSFAASEPFVINAVFPLTGSGAFLGKSEQDALSVMEPLINKAGGINGQPIHFDVHDDQSSPQQGVQVMSDLSAKHAPVVLGSALVAVCNAMFPIAKDTLVYCYSTGFHPPDGSLGFSGGPSTVDQVYSGIRYLHSRGLNKIAVITTNDATGSDADHIIDSLVSRGEFNGVSIVLHEHFGINDVSVAAQMARVRASGAQALVGWVTGNPLGTILHAYNDAGMTLPFVGGSGNLSYAEMKAYASLLPKDSAFPGPPSLAPNVLPAGSIRRAAENYLATFRAAGVHPDISSAQGYDQPMMLVAAFSKLGTNATAQQIRDFIVNSNWQGIIGTYNFKLIPQRGLSSQAVVMLHFDPAKDGFVAVSKLGGSI